MAGGATMAMAGYDAMLPFPPYVHWALGGWLGEFAGRLNSPMKTIPLDYDGMCAMFYGVIGGYGADKFRIREMVPKM